VCKRGRRRCVRESLACWKRAREKLAAAGESHLLLYWCMRARGIKTIIRRPVILKLGAFAALCLCLCLCVSLICEKVLLRLSFLCAKCARAPQPILNRSTRQIHIYSESKRHTTHALATTIKLHLIPPRRAARMHNTRRLPNNEIYFLPFAFEPRAQTTIYEHRHSRCEFMILFQRLSKVGLRNLL